LPEGEQVLLSAGDPGAIEKEIRSSLKDHQLKDNSTLVILKII
jgi:hypothetical protein